MRQIPATPDATDDSRHGRRVHALDPLYRLVRWSVAHTRGLYAAMGVFLIAGLALSAALSAGLALLVNRVAGGATQAVDEAVVAWARAARAPWMDWLALAGAALGSGVATWIVLAAGTVILWRTRHHYSAALLWLAVVGGRLLSREAKALFDRPRPDPVGWEVEAFGRAIEFPSSPSFPSGHALTSVVVFGTLAYLLVRIEPTVRIRRLTLTAAALLILLIGASRVYLGVHYPSDVIAGYLIGLLWATFCAFTIEVIRYARHGRSLPGEADLEEGMEPLREAVRGDAGG